MCRFVLGGLKSPSTCPEVRWPKGYRLGRRVYKPGFHRLLTELIEREEALRVTTTEVGTLQALLETERQGSTFDSTMERELVHL